MQNPLRLPHKTASKRPNVLRTRQFFTLLTSKCASRHKVVHFFYMSTSKSGPRMMCFVHFDLKMCLAPQPRALFWQLDLQKCSEPVSFYTFDFEMCFAPQGRALFLHVNFQKWSKNDVFCTFWLENVLGATTACTFSTAQRPKVLRTRQFLTLLTSKCASCHKVVHFFYMSTSKSGPRMMCFVHFGLEMCFAPQRRALFWQLDLQKWSETVSFLHFWLRNVLHLSSGQMAPHPPL